MNVQIFQSMWQDIEPIIQAFSKENLDYAVHGFAYKEMKREILGILMELQTGIVYKACSSESQGFSRM